MNQVLEFGIFGQQGVEGGGCGEIGGGQNCIDFGLIVDSDVGGGGFYGSITCDCDISVCGCVGEQVLLQGGAEVIAPLGAEDRSPWRDPGYESLQCPK